MKTTIPIITKFTKKYWKELILAGMVATVVLFGFLVGS